MRIAINASAMRRELYGVGNYIKHLLLGLVETDSRNEYVVFVTDAAAEHLSGLKGKVQLKRASGNRALRIPWEQLVLPSILNRLGIDVYHGPMFIAPLWKTCSQVISVMDMTWYLTPERHKSYKSLYFRFMIPQMARRSDRVIAISQSTKDDFTRLMHVAPEKVEMIHLGVEPTYQPVTDPAELERVRKKYDLPHSFLLYLGLIEPRKNVTALVQAYNESGALQGSHHLVIAGSLGWDYEALLGQIERSPVRQKIHLPSYVAASDMPALYSVADAFVYPSVYEGFGLPVLEAMACGTPVVTTNVSSMPEIVGEDGVLVPPADVTGLRQALETITSDRTLHDQLAERGRKRAQSFTWQQVARKTLAVYEKAYAGGRSAQRAFQPADASASLKD